MDIALILVNLKSNSLWHWNFEKNETANFRHVPTQRNVILNIEISNDNSCAGSPPSNSNSDNSSFSKNEISESRRFEFKPPTSVSGQTVRKPGAGTLGLAQFQRSFAQQSLLQRFLKQTLLKRSRSRRLLVRIFDWEVRHHVKLEFNWHDLATCKFIVWPGSETLDSPMARLRLTDLPHQSTRLPGAALA